MYRLFLYLRRRGFTLAEVLVATVIAGYCILPIIGSMQGNMTLTENFNHREKLRMLARSRLNKELAAGAFDHTSINSSPAYHYVFRHPVTEDYVSFDTEMTTDNASFTDLMTPNGVTVDDLLYSYKVNVSVRENVNISTSSANISPAMLTAPRGLKAVVVNAELLDGPYVIATDSISYFSLLTVPSFGDQFIWISNSSMLRILAIDSTTRAIAETFQLPYDMSKAFDKTEQDIYRPWNIDLHPSRRVLGVQAKDKIKLLNIDKTHASYQQSAGFVDVANHPTGTYANVTANSSKAEEDRGIVFRPDGKVFFVSSHSDMSLYVYKIDVATAAALNWPPSVGLVKRFGLKAAEEGTSDTEHEKFTDMIAGNDGYLYLSIKDNKNVIRFPMYPNSFTSGWTYEQLFTPFAPVAPGDAVNSCWTSKDGKYVYVIGDNLKVAQYQSQPLAKIGVATFNADDKFRDIKLSHDSSYLLMTDKKNATNLGGLRSKLINTINFSANPSGINMERAYPGYKLKSDLTVLSPTGNEVLFTHKDKPEIYFTNIASLAANVYTSSIPGDRILTYDSAGKPCAAIVTRVPEFLLIGAGNNAADSTIEFFDLHTFKFDFDRTISGLRGVPKTIGVSPQGTRFKVGYDTATKSVDAFNMIDSTVISENELSGSSRIVAYAADDETFRNANGIATYSDNFYANLEIPGTTNGYWLNGAPGGSFGDSGMNVAWVPQDMKAMPNGGFLMLFRKADGSTMLDWIGKVKWGTDKGKYQRFARWTSLAPTSQVLPATIPGSSNYLDTALGTITILRNSSFPIGTRITNVEFNTTFSCSNGGYSGHGRAITPVIVEISGGTLVIRDVANSISVASPTTSYNTALTWTAGGRIGSNSYIGWWNGAGATSYNGVVKWGYNATAGLFVPDYYLSGSFGINQTVTNASGTNRDYEIQFSGSLSAGDFPPLHAQNLAISPDERLLAIEASGTPHVVYLYDFATNNFGHETQMRGLIVDNRNMGTDFGGVPAGSRFTGGGT